MIEPSKKLKNETLADMTHYRMSLNVNRVSPKINI
jgi:hypothetical protein